MKIAHMLSISTNERAYSKDSTNNFFLIVQKVYILHNAPIKINLEC